MEGKYLPKDLAKAAELFEKGLNSGEKNEKFQHLLATMYFDGIGVKRDVAKAIQLFHGNDSYPLTMDILAKLYSDGVGVKKNAAIALEYLKRAQNENYAPSLVQLAGKFFFGDGVWKSDKLGFSLVEQAAKLGNAEASSLMGYFYTRGIFCNRDAKKAEEYFQDAERELANIPKVFYEPGETLFKVSQLNHWDIVAKIMHMVDNGKLNSEYFFFAINYVNLGSQPTKILGIQILDQLKSKTPLAYMFLGSAYALGLGVAKDVRKAIEYFRFAAGQGDVSSLNCLGNVYLEEVGDTETALKFFKLAAERGHGDAILTLIDIYREGAIVPRDEGELERLTLLAKKFGLI